MQTTTNRAAPDGHLLGLVQEIIALRDNACDCAQIGHREWRERVRQHVHAIRGLLQHVVTAGRADTASDGAHTAATAASMLLGELHGDEHAAIRALADGPWRPKLGQAELALLESCRVWSEANPAGAQAPVVPATPVDVVQRLEALEGQLKAKMAKDGGDKLSVPQRVVLVLHDLATEGRRDATQREVAKLAKCDERALRRGEGAKLWRTYAGGRGALRIVTVPDPNNLVDEDSVERRRAPSAPRQRKPPESK
ncbi:MAG: hypothetical protein JNK78_19785 [Planctomycetes bacterium]|nr:hypothetical protein [Planctomycetota bacterium]